MRHLLGWVWGRIDRRNFALASIEFGFVLLFIIGLVEAARGLAFLPLMLTSIFAILLTRWISESRMRAASKLLGLLSAGILVVFGGAAGLFDPLGRLVGRFWVLSYQHSISSWLARNSELQSAANQMSFQLNTFFTNLEIWWHNISTGVPVQLDQVSRFIWGLAVFAIAAWLSWYLHRTKQPVIATVPGVVVMALSVNSLDNSLYYFALMVSFGVIVWALFTQSRREQVWEAKGYGYSEELLLDIGVTVFFAAILVFGVVVLNPKISVRDIADQIEEWRQQDKGSGDVSPAGGLSEVRPRDERTDPAGSLPNSHLLTDPPELRQQLRFQVQVQTDRSAGSLSGYYWRTKTFETYTGDGWLAGQVYAQEIQAFEQVGDVLAESQQLSNLRIQVRSDAVQGVLIYAHQFVSASQPVTIFWRANPAGYLDMFSGTIQAENYIVQVADTEAQGGNKQATEPGYADWVREIYLQLPESLPGRVAQLGMEIVRGYSDPYTMALAIENYLRQYPYDLEVTLPLPDADVVDHFLFELQRGYCDYYASAMVVLARSVGLPARYVVGYAPGRFDPDGEVFLVTGEEAHSWAEVYLDGVGWIEFEPTAGRPSIDRDSQPEELSLPHLPPAPPSAQFGFLERLFSLPVITLILGVCVVGFLVFERISFSYQTEVALLKKIKTQIYQIAAEFELPNPQACTLQEIKSRIDHQVRRTFQFAGLSQLGSQIRVITARHTVLMAQVAYQGMPPHSLEKKALVRGLISGRRTLFMLRALAILWKRESV